MFSLRAIVSPLSVVERGVVLQQVRFFAYIKPPKPNLKGVDPTSPLKLIRPDPRSPGMTHYVKIDRCELWKGRPIKHLTVGLRKQGGRDARGRITVRHQGGGHKRTYRIVDFKREIVDLPGEVKRLEYDPNRSGYIALLRFPDGRVNYVLLPQQVELGDVIEASRTRELEVKPGNAMLLKHIPIGSFIHNLELVPGKGGQVAKSAGTCCQLIEKNQGREGYGLVRMVSREERYIDLDCMATIGVMSNPLHWHRSLGKAGRARWLGIRPTVRGVAMNATDHPHGGRNGKGHPGRPSCGPTGKLSKGFKTRRSWRNPKIILVPPGGRTKENAAMLAALEGTSKLPFDLTGPDNKQ